MSRLKLIVLVAAALWCAQLQCAVACAEQSCDRGRSVPPCHRHQNPGRGQAPTSCSHQLTGLATPSGETAPAALGVSGGVPAAAPSPTWAGRATGGPDPAAPPPPIPVVLRV